MRGLSAARGFFHPACRCHRQSLPDDGLSSWLFQAPSYLPGSIGAFDPVEFIHYYGVDAFKADGPRLRQSVEAGAVHRLPLFDLAWSRLVSGTECSARRADRVLACAQARFPRRPAGLSDRCRLQPAAVGGPSAHQAKLREVLYPHRRAAGGQDRVRLLVSVSLQAVTFDLSIGTTDPFIVSPAFGLARVRQGRHRLLALPGA